MRPDSRRLCSRSPSWAASIFAFASLTFCLASAAQTNSSNPAAFRFVYYRARSISFTGDVTRRLNIFAITSDGRREEQLTGDDHSFNPVLSPDGRKIAYVHEKSAGCASWMACPPAEYEVYVMNVDGSNAHSVVTIDRPVTISWSPDGKMLAYGSSIPQIAILPEPAKRTDLDAPLAFLSPIYVLRLDTQTTPRTLTERATGAFKWSPDGKWIAYPCSRLQKPSPSSFHLCLAGIGQQPAAPLLLEDSLPQDYSWSPDAAHLTYFVSHGHTDALFAAGVDGSAPVRLTDLKRVPNVPEWSPDGHQIVFAASEHRKSVIFAMNADGSHKTRLTEPKLNASRPMWSPDGGQVAFTAIVHDQSQVYLMNADGSEVRALTTDRQLGCSNVAWLGTSSLLLLRCGQPFSLVKAAITNEYFYLLDTHPPPGPPRPLMEARAGISFAPIAAGRRNPSR
jgi:Tol biopolymer transport system component